jgi:formylglycine-generating enzyme required for sulfatase activity
MKFVPVPGTRVLFCTWETRERDFEVFADSNQHPQFGINAQWHNTHNGAGSDHPVEPVSMLMAEQFCEWLTRRELTAGTLPPQMSYRLPSDEEWSRAALLPTERGATPKERHNGFGDEGHAPYVWGRTWFPPSVIEANYAGQESIGQQSSALRQRDAYPGTAPVGSFKPNPLGLYDLAGNVSEWCATSWDVGSSLTVIRGGAWIHSKPSDLRLDSRQACNPGTAPLGAGFRIVLDPGVQP